MEPPADEDSDNQLFAEKYYKSETLHSRPFVTPDSDVPEDLLHLWYASSKCGHFSADKQMQASLSSTSDITIVGESSELMPSQQ